MLTTFAGEEIQLAIDLQEYDRFHELENAVLQQLPYLGGCELQFVNKDTCQVLVDPILEHSAGQSLLQRGCQTVLCGCITQRTFDGRRQSHSSSIRYY